MEWGSVPTQDSYVAGHGRPGVPYEQRKERTNVVEDQFASVFRSRPIEFSDPPEKPGRGRKPGRNAV